jgi:hypothetical protein
MPAASANRLLNSFQSSPSLANTCATSNHEFVVCDSDWSFSMFSPALVQPRFGDQRPEIAESLISRFLVRLPASRVGYAGGRLLQSSN